MIFRSKLILAAVGISLTACSLYRSPGRKELEQNAFTLSGHGFLLENLERCDRTPSTEVEAISYETTDATVYQKHEPLRVRVAVKNSSLLSCHFTFRTQDELQERLPIAVEDTVAQSYL